MDIWISLSGSDEAGVPGTADNPYRTLKYAYQHNVGANRFILSNEAGDPTSLFEEDALSFVSESGVTIYAETVGTVFIKAPTWTITSSTIVFSGVVPIPAQDTEPILMTVAGSDVTFTDTYFQDCKQTALQASGSKVTFNGCKFTGADIGATLVRLINNCRISYAGGLDFEGTYAEGLYISSPQSIDGDGAVFSGEFLSASTMDFTGSSNPNVLLVDTKVDNQSLTRTPSGLSISNLRNEFGVNSIYKYMAYRGSTGIVLSESDVEIDKMTIDACTIGISADESCGVLLSNGIISNNILGLKSTNSSVIQYRYMDLYNNTQDYETEYIPIAAPDQFRIYLSAPVTYDLTHNYIQTGSEIVSAAEVVGVTYVRNIDYTITYGSELELGKISRLAAGNIPEGQLISVRYNYKSLSDITGTITPGARIRHVDPRYKSSSSYDYTLADDSPLIEAGVYTGRDFVGSSPDMGYYERTRSMSPAETILQLNLKAQEDVVILEPDVANSILLQIDNLKAYNPLLDVSEGSAIRDLLVKPAGHLLDAPRVERNYLMQQQSILSYASLTEGEMDLLAGNYFLTRRQGQRATGVVRLYFSRPSDVVVPAGTEFSTGSLTFITIREQIFLSDEMVYNTYGDLYFADVSISAMAIGEEYVVAADSIRTVSNFQHPYLMNLTNPIATENGLSPESNGELYARIQTAWTTRTLCSPRSINTMIMDRFPDVRHMTVVGARDAYMNRDILKEIGQYVGGFHSYGRVDIYVMTYDHYEVYQDYELTAQASTRIDEYTTYRPILYIKSVDLLDVNGVPIQTVTRNEYEIVPDDENVRFSVNEKLTLTLHNTSEYSLKNIRVTYVTSKSINDIQDYADSDEVRNVCSDLLIKHYVPKVVNCEIAYSTEKLNDIAATVVASVEEHVNSQTSGQDVGISTFAAPITAAGAVSFETPLSITVDTWMQSGTIVTQALEDVISCSRIEHLIAGDITATKV